MQHKYNIRRTEYRLDNRTPQSKTILIERRASNYKLFDTPEPVEKTLETHRYKVEALSGKITEFTVQERYLREYREELSNQSYKGLQKYLEGKFLDRHTYESLKALLDTWAEISNLKQAIDEQEKRRAKVYKAQEQIQKNMAALSKEGEEGRLRGRYVTQLGQSEEELAEIDRIVADTQAKIEQKQAKIETMISALGTGIK